MCKCVCLYVSERPHSSSNLNESKTHYSWDLKSFRAIHSSPLWAPQHSFPNCIAKSFKHTHTHTRSRKLFLHKPNHSVIILTNGYCTILFFYAFSCMHLQSAHNTWLLFALDFKLPTSKYQSFILSRKWNAYASECAVYFISTQKFETWDFGNCDSWAAV